jgi:hypothetical protein
MSPRVSEVVPEAKAVADERANGEGKCQGRQDDYRDFEKVPATHKPEDDKLNARLVPPIAKCFHLLREVLSIEASARIVP